MQHLGTGRPLFSKSGSKDLGGRENKQGLLAVGGIGLKTSNTQEVADSKFQSTAKASLILNMEVTLQLKIC